MVNISSMIGLIGGTITTSGGIPQIVKMIKTKKTDDLSWAMINLWLIGLSFSLTYGVMIKQIPIILTSILSIILTLSMLMLKLYYEVIVVNEKVLIGYEMV